MVISIIALQQCSSQNIYHTLVFVFTISVQTNPDWKVIRNDSCVQAVGSCQTIVIILAVLLGVRPYLRLWYKYGIVACLTEEEERSCTIGAIKPFKRNEKNEKEEEFNA